MKLSENQKKTKHKMRLKRNKKTRRRKKQKRMLGGEINDDIIKQLVTPQRIQQNFCLASIIYPSDINVSAILSDAYESVQKQAKTFIPNKFSTSGSQKKKDDVRQITMSNGCTLHVIGHIHGDRINLIKILDKIGTLTQNNKLLFIGRIAYTDNELQGSTEYYNWDCLMIVLRYIILYPDYCTLLKTETSNGGYLDQDIFTGDCHIYKQISRSDDAKNANVSRISTNLYAIVYKKINNIFGILPVCCEIGDSYIVHTSNSLLACNTKTQLTPFNVWYKKEYKVYYSSKTVISIPNISLDVCKFIHDDDATSMSEINKNEYVLLTCNDKTIIPTRNIFNDKDKFENIELGSYTEELPAKTNHSTLKKKIFNNVRTALGALTNAGAAVTF